MSSCQKDNNSITLCSPDKKIQMVLSVQDTLTYSVYYNGKCLVTPSKIAIVLGNGKTLGYGIKDYEVQISKILIPLFIVKGMYLLNGILCALILQMDGL